MELKKNLNEEEMKEIKKLIDESKDYIVIVGDRGMVLFGNRNELLVAFCQLTNKLKNEVPRELLENAFRKGLLNEEELKKETIKSIEKLKKILEEL